MVVSVLKLVVQVLPWYSATGMIKLRYPTAFLTKGGGSCYDGSVWENRFPPEMNVAAKMKRNVIFFIKQVVLVKKSAISLKI